MKTEQTIVIVGMEERISKKGNAYTVISFMDGITPIQAMVDTGCNEKKFDMYKPLKCTLELTFGKYPKITLLSVN